MSKYEVRVEGEIFGELQTSHLVLSVNGEVSRPPEEHKQNANRINSIFRTNEEREKRERECEKTGHKNWHKCYASRNAYLSAEEQLHADFGWHCMDCGKDMRGEA